MAIYSEIWNVRMRKGREERLQGWIVDYYVAGVKGRDRSRLVCLIV